MSAAIGLFAAGYARTWQGSQRDQAAQAVGADIRGQVGPGAGPPDQVVAGTYRALPGVTAATPVAREDFATGSTLQHGMLLAVVPEAMGSVAAFRSDLGARPFADLMASLVAARPDPPILTLPAGTRRVRVRSDLRLASVGPAANLPAGWAGLSVGLVVRDAHGLLHRVTSTPALGSANDAFVVQIPSPGNDPSARDTGIVAIELHLALPGGQTLTGSVGIRDLATSLAPTGEDWSSIETGAAFATWTVIRSAFDLRPTPLPSGLATVPGDLIGGTIGPEAPVAGPGTTTIVARPIALAGLAGVPLVGLVDPALLAATGAGPGDVVLIRHASSVTRRIVAADVITLRPVWVEPVKSK